MWYQKTKTVFFYSFSKYFENVATSFDEKVILAQNFDGLKQKHNISNALKFMFITLFVDFLCGLFPTNLKSDAKFNLFYVFANTLWSNQHFLKAKCG
jgi:hypothetical protein